MIAAEGLWFGGWGKSVVHFDEGYGAVGMIWQWPQLLPQV